MKTITRECLLRFPIRGRAGGCLAWLVLACTIQALAIAPSELLEKGIFSEETKGDLVEAIELYQQIVDDPHVDRSYLAQAQLRLGLCHLKAGDKSKAVSALDKLTHDFPDKANLYAIIEKQMPVLLDEIVQQIEQNYIRGVDRNELMETAIRAIVGKLDKQSDFLGPEELVELNQQVEQRLAGIGAKLKFVPDTRDILVETPLPDSPAFKQGLRAGDRILKVDGQAVSDFPKTQELATAVKLLKGPPGMAVTVEIQHPGSDLAQSIRIVREAIHLQSVLGDHYKSDNMWDYMLDDQRKVGYVRLLQVGTESAEEMQTALTELTSLGMKGLILDLRDNPGGMLIGAVAISDLFVESGPIVSVRGRTGEARVFNAKAEGTFSGFPMAVLVDRNTASAGEIIAACLQDHHRAIIVGERTLGQALVKNIIPLQGGRGALKLATAAYYRPNGKNMHRYADSSLDDDWGVRPDAGFEVIWTDEDLKQYERYRRERDVLSPAVAPTSNFTDRPLKRALEYILAP